MSRRSSATTRSGPSRPARDRGDGQAHRYMPFLRYVRSDLLMKVRHERRKGSEHEKSIAFIVSSVCGVIVRHEERMPCGAWGLKKGTTG